GESEFGGVYRAFLDHGVLLLRGQKITRERHIEFSRRFGELDRHDSLPRDRHPEYPELLMVTNLPQANGEPSNSRYTGQLWHSDLSFTLVPSLGLRARGSFATEVRAPSGFGIERGYNWVEQRLGSGARDVDTMLAAHPERQAEYLAATAPLVRGLCILSANNRTLVIALACLAGNPKAYWIWEIVGLSLIAVIMAWRLRRREAGVVGAPSPEMPLSDHSPRTAG
ncbi:MAG: TauD/TfdA dioxygenase family protein, partial [Polymorphobacter sp.]